MKLLYSFECDPRIRAIGRSAKRKAGPLAKTMDSGNVIAWCAEVRWSRLGEAWLRPEVAGGLVVERLVEEGSG